MPLNNLLSARERQREASVSASWQISMENTVGTLLDRIADLEAGGGTTPSVPAPVFTTQPTATPANAQTGDNINFTLGIATNATTLTGRLMQGGIDRSSQVADGVWSPSVIGNYTWVSTATGPGGTTVSNTISGTISAPVTQPPSDPVSYASAAWRLDGLNAITGTDTAVATIVNEGNGGYNVAAAGTGAEVQKVTGGFRFSDGKYMQVSSLGTTGLGGMFAVVRVTNDSYGSGLASFLEANPSGATIVLRNSGGTLQAIYNDGTARTNTLGAITYGQPVTIGIEIDNDAGRVRLLHPDGTISTITPAARPAVNFATIRLGQRVIGTIHEQAIFTKPVGGSFAQTFEAVAADFRAG